MRILLISDEESPYFWDHYKAGRLDGIDLILSAGDLKPEYLSFLVTLGRAPVLYVCGNHDGIYERRPPEGCECIDDKLVTVKGLRILGLGGCQLYNGGPHQYSESQMRRRIHRQFLALHRSRGIDILLTHAPLRGYGDGDNLPHRGFEAFFPLLDRYQPAYMVHGHIHQRYTSRMERVLQYHNTTIINACGYYILDIPDPPAKT